MKFKIETTIQIDAPIEKVMEVLKETGSYNLWNPFIQDVDGKFTVDEYPLISIKPPGGSKMKFRPQVLISSEHELRWRGKFLIQGLFDGEHYFLLEPISKTETQLVHGEVFSGLLVPFLKSVLKKTNEGFEMMNKALADEVRARLSSGISYNEK